MTTPPGQRDPVRLVTQIGNMLVTGFGIVWSFTGALRDMDQAIAGEYAGDPTRSLPVVAWGMIATWLLVVAAVFLVERGRAYPLGRRLGYAAVCVALPPLLIWLLHRLLPQLALPALDALLH